MSSTVGRLAPAPPPGAPAGTSSVDVDGVYTTGGDVTAAVLESVDADGLEVEGEVVPLAVAGNLVGGRCDGLPIVTKGGLVGDASTAVTCCDVFASAARSRSRPHPRRPRRHRTRDHGPHAG